MPPPCWAEGRDHAQGSNTTWPPWKETLQGQRPESTISYTLPLHLFRAPVSPRENLVHTSGAPAFPSSTLVFVAAAQGMLTVSLGLVVTAACVPGTVGL